MNAKVLSYFTGAATISLVFGVVFDGMVLSLFGVAVSGMLLLIATMDYRRRPDYSHVLHLEAAKPRTGEVLPLAG